MRARIPAGPRWAGPVLVLLLCARVQGARGDAYALVNARVVPVSGPVIDKGTVVMRDGVIEAVGAAVSVPPDARVIDVKGMTVTPGLIDGFGGIGLPAPRGGSGGGGRGGASPAPSPSALAPQ